MIVVVILGILAAIANIGYRRYVGRARTSEVAWMVAEMASKQQTYFLEFAAYLPLRADGNAAQPGDESPAAFYPVNPQTATGWYSARVATSIANAAAWPQQWRWVGMRPKSDVLYCTYIANAGTANTAVGAGTVGAQSLGAAAIPSPWFYAIGSCNLDGDAGFPGEVTNFVLTSQTPGLRAFNEGK